MEGSSRDNLVLNRRRFVFLTNPALILREEEKKENFTADEVSLNFHREKIH